jgi:cellulose synthase (UDP-forming)
VPLRTAPDLYVARGRGLPVDIGFRAPPGPVTDLRVSRLDVSLSGFYLKSLPFRGEIGPWPLSALMARSAGRRRCSAAARSCRPISSPG